MVYIYIVSTRVTGGKGRENRVSTRGKRERKRERKREEGNVIYGMFFLGA
jgi:hypothetical protein